MNSSLDISKSWNYYRYELQPPAAVLLWFSDHREDMIPIWWTKSSGPHHPLDRTNARLPEDLNSKQHTSNPVADVQYQPHLWHNPWSQLQTRLHCIRPRIRWSQSMIKRVQSALFHQSCPLYSLPPMACILWMLHCTHTILSSFAPLVSERTVAFQIALCCICILVYRAAGGKIQFRGWRMMRCLEMSCSWRVSRRLYVDCAISK